MLSVKLEKFEGPLDLLLHLIDKNKINIYDIPIIEITDQYMEYINKMNTADLDLASDFLVMAATLLDMKAKMLLPAPVDEAGEEIDPREELVERLTEYKLYKSLAGELLERQEAAGRELYKPPTIPPEVRSYEEPLDIARLLDGVTLQKLQELFRMVMRRQVDKIDPIRSGFGTIEKEPVRLADKLGFVFDYAKGHGHFSFRNLLQGVKNKTEVIVTFLACLELIRVGRLSARQEATFGEIDFSWNENCEAAITGKDMEQYD